MENNTETIEIKSSAQGNVWDELVKPAETKVEEATKEDEVIEIPDKKEKKVAKAKEEKVEEVVTISDEDRIKQIESKTVEQLTDEDKAFLDKKGIKVEPISAEESKPEDFYKEISGILGEDLEVDFEGEDPLSPKGVYKAMEVYHNRKLSSFEEQLKQNAPKEYLALEMRLNGEDPSSLYKEEDFSIISKQIDADDKPLQKEIIRKALSLKGVDSNDITDMLDYYDNKGTLFDNAVKQQTALKGVEEERVKVEAVELTKRKQAEAEVISSMSQTLNAVINKGEIGNITIPEKQRKEFSQFVHDNTRYKDGKFVLEKELDPNKLNEDLLFEFYRFRKGNISDIVQNEVKKQQVLRLKSAADASRLSKSGSSNTSDNTTKKVTLSNILETN